MLALMCSGVGCSDDKLETTCAPSGCPNGECNSLPLCSGDSGRCPLGMSCIGGQCGIEPFPHLAGDALIRGFDVPEFQLDVTPASTGPLKFSWLAPNNSKRVVCALLTSMPEFSKAGTTEQLLRMSDGSRAIERQRVFNIETAGMQEEFSFTLADLETHGDGEYLGCSTALSVPNMFPGHSYTVVELLRVGCWAFDQAKVIAATSLVNVVPSSLPDFNTVPKLSCQAQAEGTWCRTPSAGTCQKGLCDTSKPPAVDGADGSAGAAGDGNGAAANTPAVTDCTGEQNDLTCSVTGAIGQCLNAECVAQTDDAYRPPLVVSDCAADNTNGLNCYPSLVLSFGNCAAGVCQPRCWGPDDCTSAFERAALTQIKTTCGRSNGAFIGTCSEGGT
jgi:hypothetical protein